MTGDRAAGIIGIDFTSRPQASKPLTCVHARVDGKRLEVLALERWRRFDEFENLLAHPGPWIAGVDFPFGQSRRFIDNIGWPARWAEYVEHVSTLSRSEFRQTLDEYRSKRPAGDKEHRRQADVRTGAISPQKLYGVPVGLMFFEGAPRLSASGVTIPGLHQGDPSRVVVETYPGALARRLLGRRRYKSEKRDDDHDALHAARCELLERLAGPDGERVYGLRVDAPASLAADAAGDEIDALLCAVQAGWAWTRRADGFGAPADADICEGWIAEPP